MATQRGVQPQRPGDSWRAHVEAWTVPDAIAAAAPDQGPVLEPERFRWKPDEDARQPVRPSRRRALEALPEGGTVLDVGVGGGASSLGLVPKARLIVGVDPLPGMLELFTASAAESGVAAKAVLGTWPEAADDVDAADVAVCHHAVYRVAEIEGFLTALTDRARHRVVLELSAHSPLAGFDDLWERFHGISHPEWFVADEAEEVAGAMGLAVEREDIVLPARRPEVTPELVAFVRRRVYVGAERDAEIEAFLRQREPREHRVAALWWPGAAA